MPICAPCPILDQYVSVTIEGGYAEDFTQITGRTLLCLDLQFPDTSDSGYITLKGVVIEGSEKSRGEYANTRDNDNNKSILQRGGDMINACSRCRFDKCIIPESTSEYDDSSGVYIYRVDVRHLPGFRFDVLRDNRFAIPESGVCNLDNGTGCRT